MHRVYISHRKPAFADELAEELRQHGLKVETLSLRDDSAFGISPPVAIVCDIVPNVRNELLVKTAAESGVVVCLLTDTLSDAEALFSLGADLVLDTSTPAKWISASISRTIQEVLAKKV